ncbi:DUF4249 domain-containing protein [Mangrovimonas aestuarii]|uniref:DUF4249 domain-containing protein n=1 Tax=Mangrovimonas aestuarii TaxID=3018443 RepID=UPI002379AB5F|nr:DUF4249 domain-containing protein [Mangrovimonas aestuarii]
MKKLIYILTVSILFFSCEEVIDVETPTEAPRLVVDASINWVKGTTGNEQSIKLSLTAPYFQDNIPPANNAIVTITDQENNTYEFLEEGDTGIYKNNSFVPVINRTYVLYIEYDGETYTATESLKSVASIDFIEQKDNGGFSGEDIELKVYYTDPADEENYYLFEFNSDISEFPELQVYDDEFNNGNQIFAFYTDSDLETGHQVLIQNYGVSKQFYNYMFILLQQSSQEGGGPFETMPATVRGNCINVTNPDNFPLGYFRLSEVDELTYTVE